jgi:hypothetical protein
MLQIGEARLNKTYEAMQLVRCLEPDGMPDETLLGIVPVCMLLRVYLCLLGLLFW